MANARLAALPLLSLALLAATSATAARPVEKLDRGLVAVPAAGGTGNHVSWRLLAGDRPGTAFTLSRDGKVIARGLTGATSYVDAGGSATSLYEIAPGRRGPGSRAGVWAGGYLSIPLDKPAGGTTPDGGAYTYTANDASAADLDGDGRYEIVLKWDPTNSQDNSRPGYTGPTLLDAYTLDGKRLWRIDLGRNIRSGAHYTQFQLFDYDGDGRAELIVKTADGTVDGTGKVIGDAAADWRGTGGEAPQAESGGSVVKADGTRVAPLAGRILAGPEYLTLFEGRTGRALDTVPYDPPRYPGGNPTAEQQTAYWGDAYGNRADRFLAGTAFLDGRLPSAIMARGYYTRSFIAAWDVRGGKLKKRWMFDSGAPGLADYGGQGNHQLSIADVDGDGRDEVIYGAMAIDDDGRPLWNSRLMHGDAMHVGDLDPTRPGLEKFGVHENVRSNGGIGSAMLDARTGQVLWTTKAPTDTGRGVAADIDPRHPGTEAWNSSSGDLYDARGQVIPGGRPRQANFAIWWDGDRLRELLDRNRISKWDWRSGSETVLLAAEGATSNNGTKANPALTADILGDWREEAIWRTEDSTALRIYTTPHPTTHRMVTLMHDPVYRLGVAWQNTAYNQPPHVRFWLGEGTPQP